MSYRLKGLSVAPAASIRDAMIAIARANCEIALVVGRKSRLLGTVTDGDIRRALLAGATLETPVEKVMNPQFVSVGPQATRNEVLDLMRARTLRQIPVLDEERRLIGLHLLREIIGAIPRPNWAVIMAGGRGERLRPLTDSVPKPMILVAGRPILERIVLHLVGFGIPRVFIAVNYMAEVIEKHFGDGSAHGCQIDYLRESKPLGTGGALSLFPSKPEYPIVALNGDLITQWDVGRMLSMHTAGGFKLTVAVHEHTYTVPYGVVEVDHGRVVGVREKPTITWSANAGVYVIDPELLERVPKDTSFPLPALVGDCLERNESVGVFHLEEDWVDVGQHNELRRAIGRGESG